MFYCACYGFHCAFHNGEIRQIHAYMISNSPPTFFFSSFCTGILSPVPEQKRVCMQVQYCITSCRKVFPLWPESMLVAQQRYMSEVEDLKLVPAAYVTNTPHVLILPLNID